MPSRSTPQIPDTVPGPCPWYFGPGWPPLKGHRWDRGKQRDGATGCAILKRGKSAVGVLAMYSYAMPTSESTFLSWRQVRDRGECPPVRLVSLDAAKLPPLACSIREAASRLAKDGEPIHHSAPEAMAVDVPTDRCDADLPVDLPAGMRSLDELLLLCRTEAARPAKGGGNLALAVISPPKGIVKLHPQRWFNEGDYDYDFEWPTRVYRDPETGAVCGDGIRIGAFRLNTQLTGLAWRGGWTAVRASPGAGGTSRRGCPPTARPGCRPPR